MALARSETQTSRAAPHTSAAYDSDLYAWAVEQGRLLRAGRLSELDLENLAEEIETLGRSQFDKFTSCLRIVIMHLLKWDHQPAARTRSWSISIAAHRSHVQDVLADSPSLKARWDEAIARAHRTARLHAAEEMQVRVSQLPEVCPYSADEIMTRPIALDMDRA